jgi:hypothetical protein
VVSSGVGSFSNQLRRNVKRFRGGPASESHTLLYYSTLGSRVIKKKNKAGVGRFGEVFGGVSVVVACLGIGAQPYRGYRGTSLIRNSPLLGPYSRTIPRVT